MEKRAEEKAGVLMRLRRIEGQIRGLHRMVEKEAPCSQVLTQVAAVTAAMKKVGTAVVQCHMEECLGEVTQNAGSRQRESLRDFQKAVSRYIDLA
jgi:CsoR family transcriptional regulator, copper-sensing transcriptional repressor